MFANGPVILGQYRPLDSYLHRLDARAKILPIMLVLILALLTQSFLFYIAILVALVSSLLYSGVGISTLIRNFKPILLLVVITFVYHVLFSGKDSTALLTVSGFSVTREAVHMASFFSLRLVLFVSVAFLMTLTNSPSELAEAVAKLLQPLKKIGIPVNDLALILFIAIRFIPILFEEYNSIKNAQMMRGVTFTGSFISRIRKTTYIMLPVFVAAIGRADDLALAIEARGYRSGEERTFYTRSRFGPTEWMFMIVVSCGIFAVFYATR